MAARTYRTCLPLRIAVAVAAVFWAGALVALVRVPGSEPRLVAGAAVLMVFFLAVTVIYLRTSITVTRDGIVAATPLRRRPIRFDDILQIVVRDEMCGRVYSVITRHGPVCFTSLFARHRELFELLLDRADLRFRVA